MVSWREGLRHKPRELRIKLLRMEASFIPKNNHGIMDDEDLGSMSSSSSSSSGDASSNSITSSSSEFMEDATSSSSSSSSLSLPPSDDQIADGPLSEMSSLLASLPFKRGLSRHYEGKSQSFTSLSSVRCLEDLVKPERPAKKKLKSSKSYGGCLDSHKSLSPNGSSKTIAKKASRGSFASLGAKRHSFFSSKPPISPRSNNLSTQTLLFA